MCCNVLSDGFSGKKDGIAFLFASPWGFLGHLREGVMKVGLVGRLRGWCCSTAASRAVPLTRGYRADYDANAACQAGWLDQLGFGEKDVC